MILTFFSSYISRLPLKIIAYINFRKQVTNLENELRTKECNGEGKYDDLTTTFRWSLDSHAPLKGKQLRGDQAPFTTE